MSEQARTLQAQNISVTFPGVKALDGVDFSVLSGEIHALVGANGAGKSTLMKVLSGVNAHYEGKILLDDVETQIRSPKDAKNHGIEIVYQEVDSALVPHMTVAENIMLGTIANRMGKKVVVNWKQIYRRAKEVLDRLNISLDPELLVAEIPLAAKQMVLIARAVVEDCSFLMLDEPTAPLSNQETQELFKIVRDLAHKKNVGVIFISHRLPEVFEICEKITVMRNGKIVLSRDIDDDLNTHMIIESMLGRKLDEARLRGEAKLGEIVLETECLCDKDGMVRDVSIQVHRGEIVGISGLVGAGKTEFCKAIFGAGAIKSGTVKLDGKPIQVSTPYRAVKAGVALVPEERRREGIQLEDSVCRNLSATNLGSFCTKFAMVKKKAERESAKKIISELGIVTPSSEQCVQLLSGGNQQKVSVGKWFASEADVYLFDEPTKGVDVGAKQEIFQLILELTKQGKGVIYASCESSEILSITDRIYVMYNGGVACELKTTDATEESLLYYSTGGK